MANGDYIHVTHMGGDPYFQWRIHYSGSQKPPYGGRHILLTEVEMESAFNQYKVMKDANTDGSRYSDEGDDE